MRSLVVGLAIAVVTTFAFADDVAANLAQQPSAPKPTLASGTALAANGSPAAGAEVTLSIVQRPDKKGGIAFIPIATDTTSATGNFELLGDLSRVSARDLRANGAVELEITITSDTQSVSHAYTVDPDEAVGSRASRTLGSVGGAEAVTLQFGKGEVETAPASSGGFSSLAAAGATAVDAAPAGSVPDNPDDNPVPPRGGPSSCREGFFLYLHPLDDYTTRNVPVSRLTTKKHSHQTYEWDTTKQTKIAIAITGDGGTYLGGMVYSNTHSTGLGYRMNIGNDASRLFKPEWQFKKYRHECLNSNNPTNSYWLDVWRWRANKLTSGSAVPNSNPTWSCTDSTTVLMATETWVTKTSNVEYQGWFKLFGTGVDDLQSNTSSHKVTIRPDGGERRARVCGDDDYPVDANRIKERFYPDEA
jgi:hypothetical protein